MTTVHTLASGSSGNALVLSCGDIHLLVDAGISCRRVGAGLRALGLELADLTAVFITHTHTDHISGLRTLLRRTEIPVYATAAAGRELALRLPELAGRLEEAGGVPLFGGGIRHCLSHRPRRPRLLRLSL